MSILIFIENSIYIRKLRQLKQIWLKANSELQVTMVAGRCLNQCYRLKLLSFYIPLLLWCTLIMLLKNSKLSSHNKNKFYQWKYYNWPLFCLKNFLAQLYRERGHGYPTDKSLSSRQVIVKRTLLSTS